MTPEQIVRACEDTAEGHRRRDTPADVRRADYQALIEALTAERFPFDWFTRGDQWTDADIAERRRLSRPV